jgi:hypothetical protein
VILDPRQYRLDDLLRRAYGPGVPFAPCGANLWAESPQGWGFHGDVHWAQCAGGAGLAPFSLTLLADGDEVLVGDAICRPSHVTQHGRHPTTGLQVTEDKFLTEDDVVVSIVSLRNPEESMVDVRIEHAWGIAQGETDLPGGVWVRRSAPPGDDLRQTLAPGARSTMVFAMAFAPTNREAERRVSEWAGLRDAVGAQSGASQSWFDARAPRFDCADPWLTKLWYHCWHAFRRQGGATPEAVVALAPIATAEPAGLASALSTYARTQFEDGDFMRPGTPAQNAAGRGTAASGASGAPPLAEFLTRYVAGISLDAHDLLTVAPRIPDAAGGGWTHFCLDAVRFRDRLVTIVWDDPSDPSIDAYHDGDMGLTVYADGRRISHHESLKSHSVELPL